MEKKEEIKMFLNKNYYVKENKFFEKHNNINEWGYFINNLLSKIFDIDDKISREIFLEWAKLNSLDDNKIQSAWNKTKLKASWSQSATQDLVSIFGVESAEERLTEQLVNEISREIDEKILVDLKEEIKTFNDLFGVVKCIGYEVSSVVNDDIFTSRNILNSITYNEMIKERNKNKLYQKWVLKQN